MTEPRAALGLALLVLAFWMLAVLGSRSGRRRAPALPPLTASAHQAGIGLLLHSSQGTYVGTAERERWHDLAEADQLGRQAAGTLSIGLDGIEIVRERADLLIIPATAIRGLRCERLPAHPPAGDTPPPVEVLPAPAATLPRPRVETVPAPEVAPDELLVFTWDLGGDLLDSGFRPRRAGDAASAMKAASRFVLATTSAPGAAAATPGADAPDSSRTDAPFPPKETV